MNIFINTPTSDSLFPEYLSTVVIFLIDDPKVQKLLCISFWRASNNRRDPIYIL